MRRRGILLCNLTCSPLCALHLWWLSTDVRFWLDKNVRLNG